MNWRLDGIALALIFLFMVFSSFLSPAFARGDDKFNSKCASKCEAQGREDAYCSKWCECQLIEFKKEFGDDVFEKKGPSGLGVDQISKPASICTARYLEEYFEQNSASCQGDVICEEVLGCLVEKLKPMPEERAGSLIVSAAISESASRAGLGKKSSLKILEADVAEFNALQYACVGEKTIKNVGSQCLESCGDDESCKKSCSCLSKKLRSTGTDTEVGQLMAKLGDGDETAERKYAEVLESCGLQFQ